MTSHLRRLDQLLSSLGYCSRREARDFLKAHRVTMDGLPLRQTAQKVDPASIRVDGAPLDHPGPLILLLNKPAGRVCSHDSAEGDSVFDLLPARWMRRNPRPETVGRLDKDTTGALLITDDGALNHRLTSPRHEVEKVYRATVDRPLQECLVSAFANGDLLLEGEERACRPATLTLIDAHTARLTLTEGRYHQVKRMFAHFGYTVTALHRERFGEWSADLLGSGQWQVLPPNPPSPLPPK